MYLQIIYSIYMYKEDLGLSNPQCLICHKTKPFKSKKYLDLEKDCMFSQPFTINNWFQYTCFYQVSVAVLSGLYQVSIIF